MTAAQTKEHEDKTFQDKEGEIRKVGNKAQKQGNRAQGVHSNNFSRLGCIDDAGSRLPPSVA